MCKCRMQEDAGVRGYKARKMAQEQEARLSDLQTGEARDVLTSGLGMLCQ